MRIDSDAPSWDGAGPSSAATGAPRLERLFEACVDEHPWALAVEHRGERESYAGLEVRANRIARVLRAAGVGRDDPVGILVDRSIDMVAAILGVLKAGGAYLPLDPAYPSERTSYMLADSGARVLVSRGRVPDELGFHGRVVDLGSSAILVASPARPEATGASSDLAYVIYTSGSSGLPKAVLVEHTSARFVEWAASDLTREEFAVSAAATSICFDPHVFEILAPLCAGGSVLLKDSPLEPFLPDERPTLVGGVPSVMAANVAAGRIPASVLAAVVGGERLTDDLVRAMRSAGIARIANHYGPTEATVAVAAAWVSPSPDGCDPRIGRAICGNVLEIHDEEGRALPDGEPGELVIAGPMLARGYGGAASDGERGFASDASGRRVYRTGDVAVRHQDGSFEYVGRKGDFIKINGRRIAPAEVETAMLRVPGIRAAAATLGRDEGGRDRLVAHVVCEGTAPSLGELRSALRVWLPHAMLPTVLHVHDAFPLTLNNKVDRAALPGVPPPAPVDVDPVDYKPIARAAADVFGEELGLEDVGPDDDFFELGGDSLSAVAVALALEEVTGRSISPALLFHAPTPRRLHEELEHHAQESNRLVIDLNDGGSEPPVFCLPDLYGRPMSLITLARRMPPEQPVVGLLVGPMTASLVARPDFDALVDAYVSAIIDRCPTGPYRLVGYCFGGAFAQEIARRLHESGEETSLVLLDSANVASRMSVAPTLAWALRGVVSALRREGPLRTARLAVLRARNLASYLLGRLERGTPDWVPSADLAVARAHHDCVVAHRPRAYRGRSLLVMCRGQDVPNIFRNVDGMLGWRRHLLGPVTAKVVDVVHQDLVRAAYVDDLVEDLSAFFAQDGAARGAP